MRYRAVASNSCTVPSASHVAPARSGSRPHLDQPVRCRQGSACRDPPAITELPSATRSCITSVKTVHDISRVQADRRLVQHIQHPCRAVADGPGQLHPLPLPGGQESRPHDPESDSPAPDPSDALATVGKSIRRCSLPSDASLPGQRCRQRLEPTIHQLGRASSGIACIQCQPRAASAH